MSIRSREIYFPRKEILNLTFIISTSFNLLIRPTTKKKTISFLLFLCIFNTLFAQALKWTKDGNAYLRQEKGEIVQFNMPDMNKTVLVTKEQLTPEGKTVPLSIKNYFFADDNSKVLLYTNSKRVWRYETRGDYWVLDMKTKKLSPLGKTLPESSLMFAKISPDGKNGHIVETVVSLKVFRELRPQARIPGFVQVLIQKFGKRIEEAVGWPGDGFSVDEAQVIFRGYCPSCNPEIAPGIVMA